MLKKTITYTNFDDEEITEDLYFNLSKTEIMKLNLSSSGKIADKLKQMVNEKDVQKIADVFSDLIGMSYGIKDEDGKHFRKSPEIRAEFESSAAYDALFMELLQGPQTALAFIKGILPAEVTKDLDADNNEEIKALLDQDKA